MDNEDIQTQIDDQIKLEDDRAANEKVNVFEQVEADPNQEVITTPEGSGTHVSVFSDELKDTFRAKAEELGITGNDLRGAAEAYREISRGLVSAAMFAEGKFRAATEMCVAFAEILEETLPPNPPEEEVNATNEGNDSDD